MSFWREPAWLAANPPVTAAELTPNGNPPGSPPTVGSTDWTPGDPDGVVIEGEVVLARSLPFPQPSPWDGWPEEWGVPNWDFTSRFNELVDVAWGCLDLNARVMSTMPAYRTRNGEVIEPATWMSNPDPSIYSSWHEFAKQLFWDYMLGEAFVLPMARGRDGWPLTFRVIPPWAWHVEMEDGMRRYRLGGSTGPDMTDEVLHVRYKSTTDNPRGQGPLDAAGARMLTAGVLMRYVRNMAATGGVPDYTLETDQALNGTKAQELLDNWMTARGLNIGAPPVLSSGLALKTHMHMSPKDMAMLEISQFTEARIAWLLGVPPTFAALPSGDSETYKNVSQAFDYHDRLSLKPAASTVMAALSGWALPRGTNIELNRDEYSRPSFAERVEAWVKLFSIADPATGERAVSIEEIRTAERLIGEVPATAVVALTGGEM